MHAWRRPPLLGQYRHPRPHCCDIAKAQKKSAREMRAQKRKMDGPAPAAGAMSLDGAASIAMEHLGQRLERVARVDRRPRCDGRVGIGLARRQQLASVARSEDLLRVHDELLMW